jgi:hypothetical protein
LDKGLRNGHLGILAQVKAILNKKNPAEQGFFEGLKNQAIFFLALDFFFLAVFLAALGASAAGLAAEAAAGAAAGAEGATAGAAGTTGAVGAAV